MLLPVIVRFCLLLRASDCLFKHARFQLQHKDNNVLFYIKGRACSTSVIRASTDNQARISAVFTLLKTVLRAHGRTGRQIKVVNPA
jgi:hypothetical protein